MFCVHCGRPLQENAAYCAGCGRPAAHTPLIPAGSRLAGHVRLLGILWLALSAFRLIPGVVLWSFLGHRGPHFVPDVPGFVHGILRLVGTFLIGAAILGLIAGWGLLSRQPWARMLAIVLACLSLVDMPFGTALGVYTLWALLPTASEDEYREMTRATP